MIKLLLVLLSLLTINGCTANDNPEPPENAHFTTQIKPDGSKRFHFVMQFLAPQVVQPRMKRDRHVAVGAGIEDVEQLADPYDQQQVREQMLKALDLTLAGNGYCREGYFELDYYFVADVAKFTGECQESATDDDRSRW